MKMKDANMEISWTDNKLDLEAMGKKINLQLKRESGAISYCIMLLPIKPRMGHFAGENSLSSQIIKILIDPEFMNSAQNTNLIYKTLLDIGRHEIGHWEYPRGSKRGCPFDVYHGVEIYDSIFDVLADHKKAALTDFVTNAFVDIIDNLNLEVEMKKRGMHLDGVVQFYYDQGLSAKTFTPFYSFFIKIQEKLWMTRKDKELLRRFHPDIPGIDDAASEFINEVDAVHSMENNNEILMDKYSWPEFSRIFAKLAVPFLGTPIVEILIGGESVRYPSRFTKWIKDPSILGKVIVKRVNAKAGNLKILDKIYAADLYYRETAKEIPIIVEAKKEIDFLKIVGFGRKLSDLPSRKFIISDEGEIEFARPKLFHKIPIHVKKNIFEIPNIYFILDCSGSMNEGGGKRILNLSWEDKSKYHYALLGIYGVLNYLERNNILPEKIALTTFSDTSRSIIVSPKDLKKLKELLFAPQFEGTTLDLNELIAVLKTLGKSAVIMLSDGEISNWSDISHEVMQLLQMHYSCFISIMSISEAYHDLKTVINVYYVSSKENLARVMLDFTKRTYT